MNKFDLEYPRLHALIKDLSKWTEIRMVSGHDVQRAVPREKIFEVMPGGSLGDRHFFINLATNERMIPNGRYIFVNRVDMPGKVFAMRECSIDIGHTSLTRRGNFVTPVRFAGELCYKKGFLVFWRNNSGHYKPNARLYQVNLLPWVRRILPRDKFEPF